MRTAAFARRFSPGGGYYSGGAIARPRRDRAVTATVVCPRCARAFAFNLRETPFQRGGREGTPGWWRVLAYYPDCPHCQEPVEITDLDAPPPDRPARKPG